jgi:quinol-cytochrome oxidoreductase complex cytochrome b subunit
VSQSSSIFIEICRKKEGYSLPWDQIGYLEVKVVKGVPEAIKVTAIKAIPINLMAD